MNYKLETIDIEGSRKKYIVDEEGNRISFDFADILEEGLLRGTSDYYIAKAGNWFAIFHKDDPDPISDWWPYISPKGLVSGESKYYIARCKGKKAIFHKDDPNNPVSDWFDDILEEGVIIGANDYYVAARNCNYFIYHIDKDDPIIRFNDIESALYHIKNPDQLEEDYKAKIDKSNNLYRVVFRAMLPEIYVLAKHPTEAWEKAKKFLEDNFKINNPIELNHLVLEATQDIKSSINSFLVI